MPADDAGQRPFHAGDDHHGIGPLKLRQPLGQPVRPGDADVKDHRHFDAHPLERLAGFFGNWQVARAGRDDGDISGRTGRLAILLGQRLSRQRNAKRAGHWVVAGRGKLRRKLGGLLGGDASGQHVDPLGHLPREDLGERGHGLALAKNHFRIPAAAAAIEIELGFGQIGRRRPRGPGHEISKHDPAGEQLFGQLFQA